MKLYGINKTRLKKDFLIFLSKLGNEPAFHQLTLKEDFVSYKKYFKSSDHEHTFVQSKILRQTKANKIFQINDSTLNNLPIRCLINELNKPKLNEKLSSLSIKTKITSIDYLMKQSKPFEYRGIDFTQANINELRQSLIWLNSLFDLYSKDSFRRPRNCEFMIGSKHFEKYITMGVDGLYKSARLKKDIKAYFIDFDETSDSLLKNYTRESSSILLGLTEKRFLRLIKSYKRLTEQFSARELKSIPSTALFNSTLMTQQEHVFRLHSKGYFWLSQCQFLEANNSEFIRDKKFFRSMRKQFDS